MVFSRAHRLGSQETIVLDDLKPERFLLRSHCEKCNDLATMLRAKGLNADHRHEVSSDQDLLALLDANIGIGFLPRTVQCAAEPHTHLRQGAGTRSRRLPLRRCRAAAHAGCGDLHENAARGQLAEADRLSYFSASSQLIDRHALAVIRIDEARLMTGRPAPTTNVAGIGSIQLSLP